MQENPQPTSNLPYTKWFDLEWNNTSSLRRELSDHQDFLLSLPTMIEQDTFILVHGGLDPRYGRDTPAEIATFIRFYDEKPWYEYYTGTKPIIYGHWTAEGLRVRSNTIGLDSGCCFGGSLSAYCLETGEIWQERAHDIYKIPMQLKGKIEKIKSGD